MSTIVMRVDLECDKCYKKIRKVLCKLQDRENIKMISYDEKNNVVTVAGSFDAEEVSDRLCSSAGKVITDIQVARGNQMMMPGAGKAAPKNPGKENHGKKEGHGHVQGGQQGHGQGHGGQQGHGQGYGGGQQGQAHGGSHGGGGGQQGHGQGGGHGGGGGKPDKTKHVKFDMDDDDDDEFDLPAHHGKGHGNDHGSKGHGHGHGHAGEKPRVFTTNTAMARNEAPRPQQGASMAAMAPMRMPAPMGPNMTMMPQALSTPSIWPVPPPAPSYGYGAPAYGYGGGPPAGGYYGGPVYEHGAYGRNPYQPQYCYEEEPSAGCSVM